MLNVMTGAKRSASRSDADAQPAADRPHRRSRRTLVGVAVAGVVAVAVVTALAWRGSTATTAPGAAPAFELPRLDQPEATVSLQEYRGKPLVLNFWASWCGPCREEMPAFQAAATRLGDRVGFLGVNHQDSRSPALQLMKETGVEYASGYDPKGKVAPDYGVRGMPATIFISPEGVVLERRLGQLNAADLDRALKRHFGV